MFSWWTSESERGALDAVIAVHRKRFPSVQVINAAESLADKARDRLVDRMSTGLPPDTFQANIGKDLFKWVLFNGENDADSKVENLDELAQENDWNRQLAPPVRDALSFEGRMYGVPMNVHRINSLFYNKHVLNDLNLPLPDSVDELFQTLEALRVAGYQYPLSIGNRNNWTMSLFTMENLFPAVAGPQFYLDYFKGSHEPEHPLMRETLDTLLRLWPYFNNDALELDWTGGVELLFAEGEGQAVMSVMGDWATGHLKAKGFEPGVDFGVIPFPGTRGTFVFTSDSFPLAKGAPSRSAAIELLTTLGSREGQLAFNALKGSIPARVDIDPDSDLDVLGRRTWADFQHDKGVVALSGLLDPAIVTTLADAVRDTLEDVDPDPVLFALRNNYAQFSSRR